MRSGNAAQFDQVAAIDLGSNSFHMVVARVVDGELKVVDRIRETVRLAAGLGEDKLLDRAAFGRAIEALERFGQRLREFPAGSVRAVGTNTLRKARNGRELLAAAGEALGHEIEVISGYEEARLIYLGVAHSLADDGRPRLVIDIGGGSTEFIIGDGFTPRYMESLHMGCVSLTQRFFPDGQITKKRMAEAELAARQQLEPVEQQFLRRGWEREVGASGTIKALEGVIFQAGWSARGITPDGLKRLRKALISAGHIDKLNLKGLSERRAQVIPGGFAVLAGAFDALDIERMEFADGALREGALYDLRGRIWHEDVRARSVRALAERYHVDSEQAARVEETACMLLSQVRESWGLSDEIDDQILRWAAHLHEIGLDISHSQYHKHGEYIAAYSDLAGFSREEQRTLAVLVRTHRRKFPSSLFADLPAGWGETARRLAVLLRLAVLFHRGRSDQPLPPVSLTADGDRVQLSLEGGWLDSHPLLAADLREEADALAGGGITLSYA
ncbi:MAG TPA: exopolyphosphatase [Gammaproteobacteria bacterium]|nr:exopolyphosphatase [Gammaproteobacteria bacterium]